MNRPPSAEKPLHWIGSSKKDLLAFPSAVVDAGKDVKLIRERLKLARADYEVRYGK
jgi:phage-related protein